MKSNWFLMLTVFFISANMLIGMCYGQVDANPVDDHGDTYKEATELFFNIPQTGLIDTAEDIDYFRLEILEPGELTVWTTGALDTIGSIEDDAGVFANGDQEGEGNNFSIVCSAKPETYYVRVGGHQNATGNYTLHASFAPSGETDLDVEGSLDVETSPDVPQIADDHGDLWKVATELFFDIPQTGQIDTAEDIDYFRLEIPEPGELTVWTTGILDTIGSMEDDTGVAFIEGDQEGDGDNFSIVCAAKPETYYISVRGHQNATGDYTLHASFVPGEQQFVVEPEGVVADLQRGDTRATATPINLGDTLEDEAIDYAGDIDYWRVQVPFASYLDITTYGTTDTFGRLENSAGRTLTTDDDDGVYSNFRIFHRVTAGTYYIRVTGYRTWTTGSYHLQVVNDLHGNTRATATSLPLNSSLNGTLNYSGVNGINYDIDYFRMQVTASGRLTLYTTGSTDTVGRLENSAGSTLATNNDSGTGPNFRIVRNVTAGTYYIRVTGDYNPRTGWHRTGHYTIRADFTSTTPPPTDDHGNTRATATALPLDSPLPGRIDPTGDIDYFRLQIPVSGSLTVETTGSTDTYGRLESSSGSTLATNDDGGSGSNFRIVRNVTAGTYYIRVTGYRSETGGYTLRANMATDDHGNTRATATSISLDSPLTGRIDPAGEIDYFRLEATSDGELTVETTGSTDTYGYLEDSSGTVLAHNDDRDRTNYNFRIRHTVTPGTYYVRVTGYRSRTGGYTLRAGMGSASVDVNGDGVVNIGDLIVAVTHYGARNATFEQGDVNGDNVVDRADFLAILDVLDGGGATAPSIYQIEQRLTVESLRRWIDQAKQLNNTDANFQKGIAVLEQLLARLIAEETIPTATALLPNYPNPFNPETWIPYQLAKPADVTVTIYDINGHVVRHLDVGHQRAGLYHSRSRAMHWDGRNQLGESVASGVYFYTLTAGDFTATRKLLIAK